jgi:hypothetical protein
MAYLQRSFVAPISAAVVVLFIPDCRDVSGEGVLTVPKSHNVALVNSRVRW